MHCEVLAAGALNHNFQLLHLVVEPFELTCGSVNELVDPTEAVKRRPEDDDGGNCRFLTILLWNGLIEVSDGGTYDVISYSRFNQEHSLFSAMQR